MVFLENLSSELERDACFHGKTGCDGVTKRDDDLSPSESHLLLPQKIQGGGRTSICDGCREVTLVAGPGTVTLGHEKVGIFAVSNVGLEKIVATLGPIPSQRVKR